MVHKDEQTSDLKGQDQAAESQENDPIEDEDSKVLPDECASADTDLAAEDLPAEEADAADADDAADTVDLDAEVARLKDQVLRSLAEVENVKRRAVRDVENAHKFATEKLIGDLFVVLDSLEKAVETAQATDGADAIAEGVDLSLKLFVDTLARSGVEQIDPLGEPFDPQLHEAMTMLPNPDAEPNSVMEVMAKGYILNGRLVRAAKVIVVKGDN